MLQPQPLFHWLGGGTIFGPRFQSIKGVVNCQNSRDKGPPEGNSAVGTPRPYSIIILNMRFIPKASLRASSQITASSYILERHL